MIPWTGVLVLLALAAESHCYRSNRINDRLVYRDVTPRTIDIRTFPNGTSIGYYSDGSPVIPETREPPSPPASPFPSEYRGRPKPVQPFSCSALSG